MSFKEVQKRKALTSNVLQLQVDKFISNRNNQIIMPSKPIKAELNTNGFIEVLNGAIKSTGTESLESSIPKDTDLSIKQNEGFSFFVWLYIFKINNKKKKSVEKDEEIEKHKAKNVYYIFRKGSSVDEFTPTLGIIDNSKHLIIELSTSTIKKTFLLANKTMEQCHLYSIGVTFHINYDDNSTFGAPESSPIILVIMSTYCNIFTFLNIIIIFIFLFVINISFCFSSNISI